MKLGFYTEHNLIGAMTWRKVTNMDKSILSLKNMNKKTKRTVIIVLAGVVIVAAGLGIYLGVSGPSAKASAKNGEPSFDTIGIGDISLTVSGSGNLASAETLGIKADGQLVIDKMLVKAGDTISAGQPIAALDVEEMQKNAGDLKTQIMAQQVSIDTTNNTSTALSIKSPADGWVKNIVLDEDDDIQTAMDTYGYVALVATEEREIISAANSTLAKGDAVKVTCEGRTYNGVVTNENGALYVSIDTVSRTVGADAVVSDVNGNELFTSKIELAAFVPVTSSYGIITDVGFSENDEIEAGEAIYKASQYSLDVKEMYDALAELQEQYELMTAHIEAGQILSPSDGVVSSVTAADGAVCEEGTDLISIQSTDSWLASVSVDELDIGTIAVGQNVDVALDSLPNEVFEGTVSDISDMGTASGGITTYNVNVSVKDDDRFKINMTLNCEIKAQEATGAVLLPVDDLRTSGNMSYVMVKVDRTEAEKAAIQALINSGDVTGLADYMGADAQTLGINVLSDWSELLYSEVRAVQTGIENAYYIEITSGLSQGEMVLQPADTDDSSNPRGFMMGGMGEMPGQMPGQMPDIGNRQMPSGGWGGSPGGN